MGIARATFIALCCLALGACGDGAHLSAAAGDAATGDADAPEASDAGDDATHAEPDVRDDDADVCVPEDDAALCARLERACETITTSDRCGVARTIDCGACPAGQVCSALVAGRCDCPPETNAAFCARLGRACGPLDGTDSCGEARSVASCGGCAVGGFCTADGACLGPCGDLGDESCCDAVGDAFQCVAGELRVLDCPDSHPCAWVQNFEVYSCGGQDGIDPAGSPPSCDAYTLPPPCEPETSAAFCARVGAECGAPAVPDLCGDLVAHDCGACAGDGDVCNALGRCTTCGDGVVEPGEVCDDGDDDDRDDCTRACQWNGFCADTCASERNGICDDGAADAATTRCDYGSDCADCGLRADDACQGFALGATCTPGSFEGLTTCATPRGESYPVRGFVPCRERERCVAGASAGGAACELDAPFACRLGASACGDGGVLRVCDASGQWRDSPCAAGCETSALGSWCTTSGGVTVSGTVSYDFRAPNGDLTDWGEVQVAPLGGARIVSLARDGDAHAVFDVATSAADGSYRVRVPDPPEPGDMIVVELARLGADGALRYAVADPALAGARTRPAIDAFLAGERGAPWSYTFEAAAVAADPALHLDAGAEAAFVFALVGDVVARAEAIAGASGADVPGASLVVWLQPGVSWDCGACFAMVPTQVGDARVEGAMWISHDADEGYWSRPAIVHELGHWAMASFGTATLEGGLHVRQPTLPGQAWNEGFATFFSSLVRADAVYSDKQWGSFWWADLDAIAYSDGAPFVPATASARGYPDAADPVLQMMDEFTLAATLWSIVSARGEARPPTLEDQGGAVLAALSGARMNVVRRDAAARFARGYVRHTWGFDAGQHIVDIVAHPAYSEPMLADYLDALRCDDGSVDAAIAGALRDYPYPLERAPRCEPERRILGLERAPAPPLILTLEGPEHAAPGDVLTLRLRVVRPAPDRVPLTVTFDVPAGVTLAGKAREVIVDPSSSLLERTLRVHVARMPKADLRVTLSARSRAYGVTARAVYRFGRAP